jgi:hypothetical protein
MLRMERPSPTSQAAARFVGELRDLTLYHKALVMHTSAARSTLVLALVLGGAALFTTAMAAVVISSMLLALFGALLLHADPLLASLLAIPPFDIGRFLSHLFIIGIFTWIVGGWSRARFDDTATTAAPEQFVVALSTLDITMSLGALNVLFAAFVGTQVTWFFGGDAYLQAHTGLTAAAYARRGFFEVVWVVLLVVPLLLGARAVIGTDPAIRRRHSLLSLPLTALLGAIMLSAALRMRLYVSYYGLTTDRFCSFVFMAWLAVVPVLIAVTVLRDQGQWLLAGAALSGFVTLVCPDVIIAHVNLDCAESRRSPNAAGLDIGHLSTLGGDAVGMAATAIVSNANVDRDARCTATRTLLSRWGPTSRRALAQNAPSTWSRWNAGEQRGLAAVGQASTQLLAVIASTCSVQK